MTHAALQAIRADHAALQATAPDQYTAVEMALRSHNLNAAGTIATLPDGRKFVWVGQADLWISYRA